MGVGGDLTLLVLLTDPGGEVACAYPLPALARGGHRWPWSTLGMWFVSMTTVSGSGWRIAHQAWGQGVRGVGQAGALVSPQEEGLSPDRPLFPGALAALEGGSGWARLPGETKCPRLVGEPELQPASPTSQ